MIPRPHTTAASLQPSAGKPAERPQSAPATSPLRYEPSLDGYRAFAVLAVMAYHYDLLAWGFLGVKAFFVLSGFLITKILVMKSERPFGEYLGVFYQRRALRIFPLYFAYLLALAAGHLAVGVPHGFDANWLYLFTYTTNFARLDPSWFGSPFFTHLWSLSIEEQFYLVWPLMVYPLARKPRLFLLVVAGVVLSLPFVQHALTGWLAAGRGSQAGQDIADWLPTAHFDALALGAALTFLPLERISGRISVVAFVAVTALCIGVGWSGQERDLSHYLISTPFDQAILTLRHDIVWGSSLLNLAFASLILIFLRASVVRRAASLKPLVWVGKISYGMYVFHWPLMVPFRKLGWTDSSWFFVPYALLVVGVASASFVLFERYFLRKKKRYGDQAPHEQSSSRGA